MNPNKGGIRHQTCNSRERARAREGESDRSRARERELSAREQERKSKREPERERAKARESKRQCAEERERREREKERERERPRITLGATGATKGAPTIATIGAKAPSPIAISSPITAVKVPPSSPRRRRLSQSWCAG